MRDKDVLRRFDLLEPTWAYQRAAKQGFVVAIVAFAVSAIVASQTNTESWLYVLLPAGVGIAWVARTIRAAWRILTPEQRLRLSTQRSLIARRKSLSAPRASAGAELQGNAQAIAQLSDLAERMRRLDSASYEARIAVLERGCRLLEQNAALNRQLIDGYDRAAAVLEIEIDSLDIAEAIPEAGASQLDTKFAELQELKDELAQRQRLLAADVEVASFLTQAAGQR